MRMVIEEYTFFLWSPYVLLLRLPSSDIRKTLPETHHEGIDLNAVRDVPKPLPSSPTPKADNVAIIQSHNVALTYRLIRASFPSLRSHKYNRIEAACVVRSTELSR